MFLSKRKGIYYLFYNDEISGIRKSVSTGQKIKSEAMKFITQFKSNINFKKEPSEAPILRLEALRDEVINYVIHNLENTTVSIYKRVFKDLLRILGNKPLEDYLIQDFETYKNIRLSEVKKWTVNIDLRTIRAIFNFAVKWGYLSKNRAKEISLLKIPQKERLSYNAQELSILLNSMDNKLMKDITLFGLYTGCRLNEILNLQVKDIDFKKKVMIIRNKENFKTKTGKIRIIPISDNLFQVISSLNIFQKANNIFNYSSPENYIFANQFGYKFNRDYISHKFKEYVRKSNLPEHFHFHCLRHTAITTMIKNGVNLNYVKEIAGHSVISTTMNYIHIETEDLRKSVNQISISNL